MPESLREQILQLAHKTHQGIIKTKTMLREKVWWPQINKQIETIIKDCIPCISVSPGNKPEPLIKSNDMGNPWQKVHIDICGPFPTGESILGIIDASSRWPDIHVIKSTSSNTIANCLNITYHTWYPRNNYYRQCTKLM